MEKLLTISIAAYNVEKYIEQALKSCIVSKEYLDRIEVLIINDGSKDNTCNLCSQICDNYPDTFILINKKNAGFGSTINKALSLATGKYFKLLDGDDWFDTEQLEVLLEQLACIESDLVLHNYTRVYTNNKKEVCSLQIEKKPIDINAIGMKKNILSPNITYKTSILQKHKIEITENCFYTDMEYVILPLKYIKTIQYVDLNVYCYRLGDDEQSVSIKGICKHYKDSLTVLKVLLLCVADNNKVDYINYQVASMAKKVIYNFLLAEEKNKMKASLKEIDELIKTTNSVLYKLTQNRVIYIIRKSNFNLHRLCTLYYKLKGTI